jgi:hypothetical protein
MDNTREAQIASVNARYNEINKKIKNLRGTINVKKSNNEDVSQQEAEMKELVNNLKNTVSSLNELRLPAGSTKGDKEPLNFIFDLVSSTMEGITSTTLGPLELLIQLVNFFIELFIGFVKAIIKEIKFFVSLIIEQSSKLFPEISTLYSAVGTINTNNKTVQFLWTSVVDILLSILSAFKNILSGFLNLFLDKFNSLDSSISIFNDSVTKLTELANLNNQVVNDTKQRFNGAIDNLKKDLKSMQSNLAGASNKQIGLGQFGSIKGPSFDLTGINTAIDNLNKI